MVRNPRLKWKRNLAQDPKTKHWHARKMINGRVIQRAFRTKASAERFLGGLVDKAIADAYGLELAEVVPTVGEAFEMYGAVLAEAGRSPDTIQFYANKAKAMKPYLGSKALDAIDRATVAEYVSRRRAKVSDGTVRKELNALRTVSRECQVPPTWTMPKLTHTPKRRAVQPVAVVRALWPLLQPETRVAVGLCLLAGVRAAECFRATAEWVHGDELHVEIQKAEGGVNRTHLVKTLREILPTTGQLVTATPNAIRHDLEAASEKLSINPPYTGPGAFRHHCATYIVECGFTLEDVRLVLGHRQGGVTGRYVHSQRIEKKKIVLEAVEAYVFGKKKAVNASPKTHQSKRKATSKSGIRGRGKEGRR